MQDLLLIIAAATLLQCFEPLDNRGYLSSVSCKVDDDDRNSTNDGGKDDESCGDDES